MSQRDDARPSAAPAARRGLTGREAAERLRAEGPNALPELERRTALRIVVEVVREPMFALLLGAGVLYLLLGSRGEALVLFGFACFSVAIAIIQEGRSERVLEALRDLTSPRALVIRDGAQIRIPGRDVVRGDLLVLAEGDRVPADALLVSGDDVQADESLLTGESVPVRKRRRDGAGPPAAADAPPGGDDLPFVFSGTLIVTGGGLAVVTATGPRSEIGKIGHSVTRVVPEPPPLQVQTRGFVTGFAVVGLSVSAFAALLYGLLRGAWLQGLLGGIALAMSMLPEEFPLVLTVFMVMGAWRLSRSQVLTRRPAAIETLGAATVLCTDKTGTLTRNLMSVAWLERDAQCAMAIRRPDAADTLAPELRELLATAVLASRPEAVDPMDRALARLAGEAVGAAELVRGYPWLPELPALVQVWRLANAELLAAAKGAPEAIATLCHLDAPAVQAMRLRVEDLAQRGMRVLAVASARLMSVTPPESARDLPLELAGLIGFVDPLRDGIPDAVRECRSAGIRVVMITGDHPETARAIARQAGIEHGMVMTGTELARLDERSLRERAADVSVFARITPQQKLRIVEALKARGDVVAMTGDGVNDAPALRSAHIGIAMGQRGTDVAREASSLVLLDDDFKSIVRAVRLGRRIYDNIVKAVGYILAIHLPIAGLALLPIAMSRPLVLTPMLIAILEMIIDPLCSIVLEAERDERDVMRRPPRNPDATLLSPRLLATGFAQGALAILAVCGVFLYAVQRGLDPEAVRSTGFLALICANYALIFANRSLEASPLAAFARPNPSLWISLIASAGALTAIFSIRTLRGFLHLGPLHAPQVLLCLGAAVVLLVLLEGVKRLARHTMKVHAPPGS